MNYPLNPHYPRLKNNKWSVSSLFRHTLWMEKASKFYYIYNV